MIVLVIVLVMTFLASVLATRWLASPQCRWLILDYPAAHSLHKTPVPRTGGIAIIGSVVLAMIASVAAVKLGVTDDPIRKAIATVAGGTDRIILLLMFLLATVSAVDDRHRISPALRLAVHVIVAVCMVWSGLTLDRFSIPYVGVFGLGWLGGPLTVLFIVWMVNLYNFMDGLDGLAAGMAIAGFGVLAGIAWTAGAADLALIGMVIVASTSGFLVSNFPPARIFMGDVGSTSLGFLAAAFALRASHDRVFEAWIPILAFSPFIFDATITVVWRGVTGQRVFRPHQQHYYQRLVLAGWSHRKTLFAEYVLMIGAGVAACLYGNSALGAKVAILSTVAVSYLILIGAVRSIESRGRGVGPRGLRPF